MVAAGRSVLAFGSATLDNEKPYQRSVEIGSASALIPATLREVEFCVVGFAGDL